MVAEPLRSRSTLIDHPEHVPLIIIRPHYLDILGGTRRTLDVVAGAALLGVFEYWTTLRKRKAEQDPRPRPGWEWIIKSIQQLSDVLLGMFGTKTLRAALKLLSERGLISIRENAMLKVDRKRQYRLEISVVRAEIERWLTCQQATEGITAHWAKMPTDNSFLPNGEANPPDEAAKMPDASAESAESVFRESSLETPEDNPDLKDSVAGATGGDVPQEELDLTIQPHKRNEPVSDLTPSPDEMPPTPPSSARPSTSHAAGAPEGYEFRYASGGSGRTVHLAKLGATETMCGKSTLTLLDAPKDGRSYGMCPLCMAKHKPTPRVDQPIRDAIAEHVQGFEPTMATDLTGVLASLAIAVWTRKLGRKLNGNDYTKVARSVIAFADDWKRRNPDADLPTGKQSFENHFTKFVSKVTSAAMEQKSSETRPEASKPTSTRRSAGTLPYADVPPEELTDEQLREKWS